MSATQLKVSQRFIDAMGAMVDDEQKVQQVVFFISTLSDDYGADDFMSSAERTEHCISIDESERTTLEMVHNHYQSVLA